MKNPNSSILLEEGASRFRNFIATGGVLSLSQDELRFRGKPGTEHMSNVEIPLKNVSEITCFRTLNINPNGITLLMKDGEIEHFVVDDRKKWHKLLQRCLKARV